MQTDDSLGMSKSNTTATEGGENARVL